MAYGHRRHRQRGGLAAKAAHSVARRAYKGAIRMPKRKLARVYATKCGQVAWRATKKLGRKAARYGNRHHRRRRHSRLF